MERTGSVVLLSGGQDSTTALFWAKKHLGEPLHALTIEYGQRHWIEVSRAKKIANLANAQHHVTNLGGKGVGMNIGHSALREHGGPQIEKKGPRGLPTSFVPGRNLFFMTAAAVHAYELGIPNVVIGCSAVDNSGYPDCRATTIDAMETALAHGLAWPVKIWAPIIALTKPETVRLAATFGADCWEALGHSWTCYTPQIVGTHCDDVAPCGTCPACELRIRGFAEAGVDDPAVAQHGGYSS